MNTALPAIPAATLSAPARPGPTPEDRAPKDAVTVVIRTADVAAAAKHAPRLAEHFGCHTVLVDPQTIDHVSPGHLVIVELTRDANRLRGSRSFSLDGALQDMASAELGDRAPLEVLEGDLASLRSMEREIGETRSRLEAMPAQRSKILNGAQSSDLEAAAKELAACDAMKELLEMRLKGLRAEFEVKGGELHALATVAAAGFRDRAERVSSKATRASEVLVLACLDLGESDTPDLSIAGYTKASRRAKSLWMEYEQATNARAGDGLRYANAVLGFAAYLERAEESINAECELASTVATDLQQRLRG